MVAEEVTPSATAKLSAHNTGMLAIEADKSETTKGHRMESNQLDDKRVELTRKLSVNSPRSLANDTRQTAFKGNMRACEWASCGQRVALPCHFRGEKTAISIGPLLTKISETLPTELFSKGFTKCNLVDLQDFSEKLVQPL